MPTLAVELDADLVERQEPARLRRHRHAGERVRVHDAGGVGARAVDGGMDDEAGGIDRPARRLRRLALRIHLDQASWR